MSVWKLNPVARQNDPHWKAYRYRKALIVHAESPCEARLKATRWYKENFQGGADIKIQQFYRSAFDDAKLYEVIELISKQALKEYEDLPVTR